MKQLTNEQQGAVARGADDFPLWAFLATTLLWRHADGRRESQPRLVEASDRQLREEAKRGLVKDGTCHSYVAQHQGTHNSYPKKGTRRSRCSKKVQANLKALSTAMTGKDIKSDQAMDRHKSNQRDGNRYRLGETKNPKRME